MSVALVSIARDASCNEKSAETALALFVKPNNQAKVVPINAEARAYFESSAERKDYDLNRRSHPS